MATNEKGYLVQLKSPEGENVYPVIPPEAIVKSDGSTYDFDSLFTSVSNGKALVASAVTDKGVKTAADATYQQMAENVQKISVAPSSCAIVKCTVSSDVTAGDALSLTPKVSDKSALGFPAVSVGRSQVAIDDRHWVMVQSSQDKYGGQVLTLCTIDDSGNITMGDPVYPTGDRYYYGAVFYHPSVKRIVAFGSYSGIIGKIYSVDDSKNSLALTQSFTIPSSIGVPYGYVLNGDNVDILCRYSSTLTMVTVNLMTGSYTTASGGTDSSSYSTKTLYPIGFRYNDSSGGLCYVKNGIASGYSQLDDLTNYVLKSSSEVVQTDGNGNVINRVSLTSGYVLGLYEIVSACQHGLVLTKKYTKFTFSNGSGTVCFPLYYYEFSTGITYFLGTGSTNMQYKYVYPVVQVGKWLLISTSGVYKSSDSYNVTVVPSLFKLENGTAIPFGEVRSTISDSNAFPVIGVALNSGNSGSIIDVMIPPHVV